MVYTINVATYNISGAVGDTRRFYPALFGNGDSRIRIAQAKDNLERIAGFVEERKISILASQEVDVCYGGLKIFSQDGLERLHQAEYLARRLSMNLRYVTHSHFILPNGSRVTTGLALLSKFPITHSEEIRFSQRRLPLVRRLKNVYVGSKKALRCVVNVNGTELSVINAHTSHKNDRLRQKRGQKEYELERILESCISGPPCLLTGDLNTTPLHTREGLSDKDWFYKTDEGIKILAQHRNQFQFDHRLGDFISMPPGVEEILTAPSDKPNKKLDYIFLFPGDSHIKLSPEEVPDFRISDHRPVLAQLTFNQ